jgi:hypothetical protein
LPLIPAGHRHGPQPFILGLVPAAIWAAAPPKADVLTVKASYWMHALLERADLWLKDPANHSNATYIGNTYDVRKCTRCLVAKH